MVLVIRYGWRRSGGTARRGEARGREAGSSPRAQIMSKLADGLAIAFVGGGGRESTHANMSGVPTTASVFAFCLTMAPTSMLAIGCITICCTAMWMCITTALARLHSFLHSSAVRGVAVGLAAARSRSRLGGMQRYPTPQLCTSSDVQYRIGTVFRLTCIMLVLPGVDRGSCCTLLLPASWARTPSDVLLSISNCSDF